MYNIIISTLVLFLSNFISLTIRMINERLICEAIIALYIHCTEVYDNQIYTKVLRVSESEYRPSIEYFRKLIERELDIPRVCQLSLSVAGVPMDPLETMEEFCLSDRVFKNPNPIALQYYTTSLNLEELTTILDNIDNAIIQKNIMFLNSLFQRLTTFLRQVNWVSKEATGTKLYINYCGFLEKLKNSLISQTDIFSRLYQNANEQILLGVIQDIIGTTLRFIWCFGGGWEDCLILSHYDFLGIILRIFNIANDVFTIHTSIQRDTCDLLYSCFGFFQMIVEQKRTAIELGNNDKFLSVLKDALLCQYFNWGSFELCLQSLIFFCISIHSLASTKFYSSGIYTEILNYFENVTYSNSDNTFCRILYNVNLITLNALRRPGLILDSDIIRKTSILMHNFTKNVSVENIVQYEVTHNTSWNIIEYFVAFFFVPTNSPLGKIMLNQVGYRNNCIIDSYFGIADLVLEVLFRQKKHRKQVLAEKLLDLLVIAHWRRGGIYSKVRLYFPNEYFPVPSLHDIAAISAFCAGLGDYSELMHS